ncbi:MAG: hypothetical protein ABW080_07010 [Candidatus Thiodiazotropha sp.]
MNDSADSTLGLAADAAFTSSLLGIGRSVSLASGLVLAISTGLWILGHPVHLIPFIGSILLALLQGYFAQRVRFDADIFRFWANRWDGSVNPIEDLNAFDARVGRISSDAESVEANLAQRKHGALRLLSYQVFSAVMQLLLMAMALRPGN